ncbi:hypothetical protein AAP_05744 [Ascosphaera apis ARSEF 7405]|uniref:Rhodopsin domain-containing protein n=1 Tax=Ascosphaera apis ARSEF 7405 TaxID=392613 RepID=A0A162I1C0_9EURO|nr:hypothetical protein AAP_05744 [Ascosphaera apis ARSEF 7405]
MPTVRHTEVLDFVAHILYTTALFICRLSGVAFYQRVAVKPSALHKIILCSYPFLIAAFAVQFFLLLFHCIPVTGMWPYEWQHEPKDYKCLAWGVVYLTNSGLSLVCDMLVFVIPGVLIHQLHTTVERKLQLTLVMFPGVLVLVISAVRVWLVDIGQFDVDQSWQYNPMLGVENAEIAGTLIALSVPGLKPLLGVLYREVSSSVANTMGNGRPGKGGGTSMAKSYMRHRPRTEDEWKILGGHNDQFEMVVSEANVSCDNSEYTWPSHGGGVGVSNIRITDEVHVASETPDSSHELRHSRSTRKESV